MGQQGTKVIIATIRKSNIFQCKEKTVNPRFAYCQTRILSEKKQFNIIEILNTFAIYYSLQHKIYFHCWLVMNHGNS